MPGQTGGVTMAPLFAQRDRHMAAGFPLAVTGRKEEINSKYSAHPPCLPPCLDVFLSSSKLKCVGIVCRLFCTYFPANCGQEWVAWEMCGAPISTTAEWNEENIHCFHSVVISRYSRGSSYVQVCFCYKLTLIFPIALDFADLVARFLCIQFFVSFFFINIVIIFILLVNPNEQRRTMSCLSQSELV